MTREERLRAALDGTGLEDRAADLATLPAAQVDLIVSALRASGRAALARDKARRRQRVADRRKYNHIEDYQQAEATNRQTLALARRLVAFIGVPSPRDSPRSSPRSRSPERSHDRLAFQDAVGCIARFQVFEQSMSGFLQDS